MPTLLAMANVDASGHQPLDGSNLTKLLKSPDQHDDWVADRHLFWNGMAVRHGPWKLVRTGQGKKRRDQLFNLDNDIGEQTDLSGQFPERLKEMQQALKNWKQDVEHLRSQQPSDRAKGESP